jgi:ketosteroid isomerase-like protein
MGHSSLTTVVFSAIAVFAAIACGSGPPPEPEPVQTSVPEPTQAALPETDQPSSSEPEVVVSALIDAMAANDAEQMRALFNANASQAHPHRPARSGEAFFSWLESDIIQREGRVEEAQLTVNGNDVVVTGQYHSRGYTSEANFLLTVENGLITRWRIR